MRALGLVLLAVVFCAHGWQCVAEDHAVAHGDHLSAMPDLLDLADSTVDDADHAMAAHPKGTPAAPPFHPLAVHLALFFGAFLALALLAVRLVGLASRGPPRRPRLPSFSFSLPVPASYGRHALSLLCVSRT